MNKEEYEKWESIKNDDKDFVKKIYELSSSSIPINLDKELEYEEKNIKTIE